MAKESSGLDEQAFVSRVGGPQGIVKTEIKCAECGAQVDIVENDDGLVEKILGKSVKDRPKDTYKCPNGHTGDLEVA